MSAKDLIPIPKTLRLPADLDDEVSSLLEETHLGFNETVLLALRGMLDLVAAPPESPAPMPKLVALGRAARSVSGQTLTFAEAPLPKITGEEVRAARLARGLTMRGLAEATGFQASAICNVENGRRKPGRKLCAALRRVLNPPATEPEEAGHGR